jgi:hypothetical protein
MLFIQHNETMINTDNFERQSPVQYDPIYYNDNMIISPFWNSTRYTRNQSYDIRGDVPTYYREVSPWMNPEIVYQSY